MQSTLHGTELKFYREDLLVRTESKQQMINVTREFSLRVARSGIQNGFAGLHSQHTTAVLLVNEWQGALSEDIAAFLGNVVPEDLTYKHNDPRFSDCDRSNATSHLRSLFFSNGVLLPVTDGNLVLGRFQNVILVELDGPRDRTLKLHIMGG